MTRDPCYDLLFEPVKIGPVTAKNRFYQVPHCNGMGHASPQSLAAMRGIKAEGGWAAVCTEMTEIHHSSDVSPFNEGRIWDDSDIPQHRLVTDAIHEHGALAGIQLAYSGHAGINLYSRVPPLAPSHRSTYGNCPVQARAMTKRDIRDFRHWHKTAVQRARTAGYDIVYVYAGHDLTLLMHFLSRQHNRRTDEYGGSLENRVRLYREVLEETKEAIGDSCAVATRFAVDELIGAQGLSCEAEGRDVVEMLSDIPDLWDVNLATWENDSVTSRFAEEGYQEDYISFVKRVTDKPVVGVGRYTSVDRMVSIVKRGIVDLIGAARPSIADPFLPRKIQEGRIDEIRECIGCNICVASDQMSVPIRCTQNPTMGEEWRSGWHPEKVKPNKSDDAVLVVGAGPAGLEYSTIMSKRGYSVMLAESQVDLGGRARLEAQLPGLSAWARVIDYRELYLRQAPNIDLFLDNALTASDILEMGVPHVITATGSRWRNDGYSRHNNYPITGLENVKLFTPDDILAGNLPSGRVAIFDDDHYYMASAIAEKLVAEGCEVSLVTPDPMVASWTVYTMEQHRIQSQLLELGVALYTSHNIVDVNQNGLHLSCIYSGRRQQLNCESLVLVTERLPIDDLYLDLMAREAEWRDAGIQSVTPIGDSLAPGTLAAAIYSGHLAAREFDEVPAQDTPFKREMIRLDPA